ncbi:MAG TPA: hypothetical protein VMF61_14910 [Candidatus Acidoferrales bacterium]|nr:hypothetical protein [Candidatus Acidoferrales bacterium]
MTTSTRLLTLLAFPVLLTACGTGGASEPPVTQYDPAATSTMQFVVGVATIASDDGTAVSYGLNTVSTLRQSDGLSGTLYNEPQIIGPTSFSILPADKGVWQYAGADLGTNHITWATLNQTQWTGPPIGPAQGNTGVFGYGLCPCDSNAGPENGTTPFYQAFNLPIYGPNSPAPGSAEFFYGGPPAFPPIGPTLLALGFDGYSLGFTDFDVTPVLGTYHLYAAVPPANTTPANPTPSPGPNGTPTPAPGILASSAQLTSLHALPQLGTPSFSPDRKGGGTIGLTVPAGVRETMVVVGVDLCPQGASACSTTCLRSHFANSYYTIVTHRAGPQKLTLADDLGPVTDSGAATGTICPTQAYHVYAAGVDYPAYEASYPNNLNETPNIAGPGGQSDVTTSGLLNGTYP